MRCQDLSSPNAPVDEGRNQGKTYHSSAVYALRNGIGNGKKIGEKSHLAEYAEMKC